MIPIDADIQFHQVQLPGPMAQLHQAAALQGLQQENQIRGLQAQQAQKQMQAQQILDNAYKNHFKDGNLDMEGVYSELASSGQGSIIPTLKERDAKLQETLGNAQVMNAKLDELHEQLAGEMGAHMQSILEAGGPSAAENAAGYGALRVKQLQSKGLMTGDEAAGLVSKFDPSDEQTLRTTIKAMQEPLDRRTRQAVAAKMAEPMKVGPGEKIGIPATGQVLLEGGSKAPTAEEDKAKYIGLQAKVAQKIPLTPEEQAWASGYEKAVTLGPEASAAASAERQLVGIQAAIAQQGRAQAQQMTMESRREGFHEQETGRDKLTKEETKYHDALAQAQALRDTVASAQAGNKVAASMQSLETAMAAIRAQGLNRINAVEIGMPASAGNAWDRIQGWFGKATEGQPVPKDIQKDMTDFATMLERTAYNKYSTSHKSITGRYNLRDETPEPAPPSTVTGGPRTGGKGDPLGIR